MNTRATVLRRGDRRGGARGAGPRAAAAALLAGLLTGCASDGAQDLRYRQSRLLAPLEVPAGLARPEHTGHLSIPEGPAAGAEAVDIRPPETLGGG